MTDNSEQVNTEERLKWYERILKLSQRVSDESLESVCRYLMDDVISACKAEAGYLLLLDHSSKFRVALARSGERSDIPINGQSFSESILLRSIKEEAPLIIDDAISHPDFGQAKSVIAHGTKSVLVLPLFFEKKAFGAIYLENKNQKAYFEANLLEFLTLFSTQGAVLLHSKLGPMGKMGKPMLSKDQMTSKSPNMQKVLDQALAGARTQSNILVLGETGVGKEVMAKYIHNHSSRSEKLFVAINCSAIPETLIESELFGYKKGAFTGAASDREGLIRQADGGTLFLDEIGDLPLHMQAKLLRVIQERVFTPVGSTKEEPSNFRLIAATHQPLEDSVNQGLFRQDLFYRINTLTLQIPNLKARPEDLIDLAELFIRETAQENNRNIKGLSQQAAALLLDQEWPGNIRQLQNAIQRAVVLVSETGSSYELQSEDFSFLMKDANLMTHELPKLSAAKADFIKTYVKKAVLIHKGNKTKAAKALGVDPKTLYRHLLDD